MSWARGINERLMLNALFLAGDNDRVLTASDDHTVKLWEKRSGKCVATLRDHTAAVYTAVWCNDGSMLASGGERVAIAVNADQRGLACN